MSDEYKKVDFNKADDTPQSKNPLPDEEESKSQSSIIREEQNVSRYYLTLIKQYNLAKSTELMIQPDCPIYYGHHICD